MAVVGVLALQGDFEAHVRALARCGVEASEVRRCAEVEGLDGLILPGGESSTLLNLMEDEPWFPVLRSFHEKGGAILGTCAGAILLSREVFPRVRSLALLDASIERNAYGRQVDSFEARLAAPALGASFEAVFIRAPRFLKLGPGVEVVARHGDQPVFVREGRVAALTFHPELTTDDRLHRWFVELTAGNREDVSPARAAAR